jgi:uncharacterized membrane protein YjgN (DUF898 family)
MPTVLQEMEAEHTGPDGVTFDGRGGELFVVYIVNILLTLVTLGIYRFWGKTRIRQYVWSHLRYEGDAFEYTGTGLELFLGFLIVVLVVVLPVAGLAFAAVFLLGPDSIWSSLVPLILYLGFFCLFPIAIYRAYRYRLSRSLWRGIRFGLTGKATTYALKFVGYLFLQVITLGLASPFTTIRLYEYLINNIWMGSGRFSFEASWKPLMRPYLMFWGGLVATGISYGVLMTSATLGGSGATAGIAGFLLFVFGIATLYLSYRYAAATYRHVVPNIKFGDVRFSTSVGAGPLFGLLFGNLMLLIFTFGLAFPWTITRIMNFLVKNLDIHGEPDFEKISQSTEEMPTYGEGLAEAFDIGGI